MIGQADGYISAAVHAPTSGVVTAVDLQPVPHPSGLADWCVTIESDGEDRWIEREPVDYRRLHPSELRNLLRNAGVVGLGGAAFPSAVKLNPGGHCEQLETLILNGAECEPWITCDDRIMRERAADIVAGLRDHGAPAGAARGADRHRGRQAGSHRRHDRGLRRNGLRRCGPCRPAIPAAASSNWSCC